MNSKYDCLSIILESKECYIFISKAKSLSFSSSACPGSHYNQEVMCYWKTGGEGKARSRFVEGDPLCSCMLGHMKLNLLILDDSEMALTVVHSLTHMRHLALISRLWDFMWPLHKCQTPILLLGVYKWLWVSSLARKFSASRLCPHFRVSSLLTWMRILHLTPCNHHLFPPVPSTFSMTECTSFPLCLSV